MKLRSITQNRSLKGKVVLVRVDYNVDMRKGKVMNTERIERTIPLITYLAKKGAKIVLLTHLGRPKGKRNSKYSVRPLVQHIKKFTKRSVHFSPDIVGSRTLKRVANLKPGRILLLENLRFNPGEEANTAQFAQDLARLGNIYVNEAFSMCHREHASIVGIPNYLPSYAGMNLQDEVAKIQKVLKGYKRPAIAIVGGVKVSTKTKLIENLAKKYNHVLLGGALANTFLAAKNIHIGKSLYEKKEVKTAKRLLREFSKKIVLPVDVVVARRFGDGAETEVLSVQKLNNYPHGYFYIVDIGPTTGEKFADYIRKAKTIVWNGPMGLFEKKVFAAGTIFVSQEVAKRAKGLPYGVIGGGETISAVEELSLDKYMDFVSTGGGALLAYLEGKVLPGIKPLLTK